MEERIDSLCTELQKTSDAATAAFGSFSAAQLNWKPAEKSWGVAQCFDHLITTHSMYFPLFQRMAEGTVKPTLWERSSPLSGFFGRFLINAVRPENPKKVKTTSKAQPAASEIDAGIIKRFAEHQAQMIRYLRKLPTDMDPARTIITSPLLGFVTYSLDDCFTVLETHCKRHFGQAKRVTETEGFPK